MSDSQHDSFPIKVGIHNMFGRGRPVIGFGGTSYKTIDVDATTRVGAIKNAILISLGYPRNELFVVLRRRKVLQEDQTVVGMKLGKNDSSLEIVCTDREALYAELRALGKM